VAAAIEAGGGASRAGAAFGEGVAAAGGRPRAPGIVRSGGSAEARTACLDPDPVPLIAMASGPDGVPDSVPGEIGSPAATAEGWVVVVPVEAVAPA
jgi:hypothetical protein